MGRQFAEELAGGLGGFDLETSIGIHLRSNCYPAVPHYMTPIAVEAVELVNGDEPEAELVLPEGVLFKGRTVVKAWEVVEAYRLDAWIDWEDE